MIYGTGIDIVNIGRIKKSMDAHGYRFIEKVLSPDEEAAIPKQKTEEFIAGRFAVKEALVKACGLHLDFSRITILNDKDGRPFLAGESTLPGRLAGMSVHISISHDTDYAVASVILEDTSAHK